MFGLLRSKLVWPHGTHSGNTIHLGFAKTNENGGFLSQQMGPK
jgi:hypothetical protein